MRNRHFGGCASLATSDTVWIVQAERYREIVDLGSDVVKLLLRLEPRRLELRLNPAEPTVGELIALALLELDRASSADRLGFAALPGFASDFLNRRLTARLLNRYPTAALAPEFDRRLQAALAAIGGTETSDQMRPVVEHLCRTLADLKLALLAPHGQPGPGMVTDG